MVIIAIALRINSVSCHVDGSKEDPRRRTKGKGGLNRADANTNTDKNIIILADKEVTQIAGTTKTKTN